MSKYRFILLLLSVGSLVPNIFSCKSNEVAKTAVSDNNRVKDSLTAIKYRRDSIATIQNLYAVMESEDALIKNSQIYFGNDSSRKVRILDNYRKSATIVFRFSGLYCDACIESTIERFKHVFPDFSSNPHIVLLTTDVNDRVKESFLGKRTASLLNQDLGIPLEVSTVPFIFVIDKEQQCKMLFIPERSKPELTETYLRIVKHRFLISKD